MLSLWGICLLSGDSSLAAWKWVYRFQWGLRWSGQCYNVVDPSQKNPWFISRFVVSWMAFTLSRSTSIPRLLTMKPSYFPIGLRTYGQIQTQLVLPESIEELLQIFTKWSSYGLDLAIMSSTYTSISLCNASYHEIEWPWRAGRLTRFRLKGILAESASFCNEGCLISVFLSHLNLVVTR